MRTREAQQLPPLAKLRRERQRAEDLGLLTGA